MKVKYSIEKKKADDKERNYSLSTRQPVSRKISFENLIIWSFIKRL